MKFRQMLYGATITLGAFLLFSRGADGGEAVAAGTRWVFGGMADLPVLFSGDATAGLWVCVLDATPLPVRVARRASCAAEFGCVALALPRHVAVLRLRDRLGRSL